MARDDTTAPTIPISDEDMAVILRSWWRGWEMLRHLCGYHGIGTSPATIVQPFAQALQRHGLRIVRVGDHDEPK